MKKKILKGVSSALCAVISASVFSNPVMSVLAYRREPFNTTPHDSILSGGSLLCENVNNSDVVEFYFDYYGDVWNVIGTPDEGAVDCPEGTVALLSAEVLGDYFLNGTSVYSTSPLREKMERLAFFRLTAEEEDAIVPRDLEGGSGYNYTRDFDEYGIMGESVDDCIFWPLSEREVRSLYLYIRRDVGCWFLRSPGRAPEENGDNEMTRFFNDEYVTGFSRTPYGARPACYLDLSHVLFTSLSEGGKVSGPVGAGALNSVSYNMTDYQWKMTLLDDSRDFRAACYNNSVFPGSNITISYTGATVGPGEYISAVICDDNDEVLYYGNIKDMSSGTSNGTIDITIPSGLDYGTYTLKVFSEKRNDYNQSDYASELSEITICVDPPSYNGMTPPTPTPTIPPRSPSAPDVIRESGVAGFVERLYSVALERPSDPAGKQDWIDAITMRGETGASCARGFLYSPEFLNKQCTNEEFVAVLYRTFFDREPDQEGFNAWVGALRNGSPKEEIIEGFINSTEWANLCVFYGIRSGGTGVPTVEIAPNGQTIGFASRLYSTCLMRSPDQEGVMAWARQLANQRDTGTGAAHGFFFSYEFVNQNVSNEEYVTRLYRTFMDREPDQAGFDAWVAQLRSGVSREEVFNGFSQSIEFARICASYGIVR